MRNCHRLHRLAAAGLMVGALIIVSCSTTPAPPPTPGGPATAAKPYGSLTIATDFGTGHLDPLLDTGSMYLAISSNVFDNLVNRDVNNGEIKPGIAERWEVSPDGLTHTFYIRKGVKFHDGSDLTGADVKFSIERLMGPGSMQTGATIWRRAMASVEVKDDYTVVLHLNTAQFELLSGYDGPMTSVMPKKYIEENGGDYFTRHPIGSGPWKAKYEPGVRVELEAVDNHWRAIPKFKNITILNIPQEATRVAMLKTGELDMAAVSADSVPGLEAAGLSISSYWGGNMYGGFLLYDVENPQKYAVGDVRVRKAMQLAINSKEIADNLFGGRGQPVSVASLYVESDSRANAYDPSLLKADPYEPEGAKRLLTEAGYPNGFNTMIFDTGAGDMRSIIAMALWGYWRKIGIDVEIISTEYGAFFPMMQSRSPRTWNSFYIFLVRTSRRGWQSIVSFYTMAGNPKNSKNPRIISLVNSIPQTPNPVERERMALEAAVLARNEYSTIAVVGKNNLLAFGKKVGDFARQPGALELGGTVFETITHAK